MRMILRKDPTHSSLFGCPLSEQLVLDVVLVVVVWTSRAGVQL